MRVCLLGYFIAFWCDFCWASSLRASPILLAIRHVPIKSEFGSDLSFSTFLSLDDFHDDDGCSHMHLPLNTQCDCKNSVLFYIEVVVPEFGHRHSYMYFLKHPFLHY